MKQISPMDIQKAFVVNPAPSCGNMAFLQCNVNISFCLFKTKTSYALAMDRPDSLKL